MDNQQAPLTKDNVLECFKVYPTGHKQNIKKADEILRSFESQPQEYFYVVYQIFEDESFKKPLRQQALVQMKNLVKRNWQIRKGAKVSSNFNDELKENFQKKMLEYLQTYYDPIFRPQIDDMLLSIAKTDFPQQYHGLYNNILDYFTNLNKLSQEDEEQFVKTILSPESQSFLKSIRSIFIVRAPRKIGFDPKKIFDELYIPCIEQLHPVWEKITAHLEKNIQSAIEQNQFLDLKAFMKVCRRLDSIYTGILVNGYDDMVKNETIRQIVQLMVQKTYSLVELNNNNVVKTKETIQKQIQKNVSNMIHMLSDVRDSNKLVLVESLEKYFDLNYTVINSVGSFDESVYKEALLALNGILKTFQYYDREGYSLRKSEEDKKIQEECVKVFFNFFNKDRTSQLLTVFCQVYLTERKFLNDLKNGQDYEEELIQNIDYLIENDQEQIMENPKHFEVPLQDLVLSCTKELMMRFPENTVEQLHNIGSSILQNKSGLSYKEQDNIFLIFGLLPDIYKEMKVDPQHYFNLEDLMQYLHRSMDEFADLGKRIPVLVLKWKTLFTDVEQQIKIIDAVCQIMKNTKNFVILYECCLCLKKMIEEQKELRLKMNFVTLTETVLPLITGLLGVLRAPEQIKILIELLTDLFIGTQFTTNQTDIILPIFSENIENLLKIDTNDYIIQFSRMFQIVLTSFPPDTKLTDIYRLSLKFIYNHLSKNHFEGSLISLWLFLSKEVTDTQEVNNDMKDLLISQFGKVLQQGTADIVSNMIRILEEYILAELIPVSETPEIIKELKKTYESTFGHENPTESHYDVKIAILSLMTSLFIIILEKGSNDDIVILEDIFLLALRDLLNDFNDTQLYGLKKYRYILMAIINRLIIVNFEYFVQLLKKLDVDFNQFLRYWVANMKFVDSRVSQHLITLALCNVLPEIQDFEFIKENIHFLLDTMSLIVSIYVETEGQGPVVKDEIAEGPIQRMEETRVSERKNKLRKRQLYQNIDLKKLFNQSLFKMLENFKMNLKDLGELLPNDCDGLRKKLELSIDF